MPNVCHEFFRVGKMREGFLKQVLILFLKKNSLNIDREEGEVILRGRMNRGNGKGKNVLDILGNGFKKKEIQIKEKARNKPKHQASKTN